MVPQIPQGAAKKSLKFMQKYWHKGAYYQTGADDDFQESKTREEGVDAVYRRDYSAPTGEDKFDKSILPKVMQAWDLYCNPLCFGILVSLVQSSHSYCQMVCKGCSIPVLRLKSLLLSQYLIL